MKARGSGAATASFSDRSAQRLYGRVVSVARATEWWEFKLLPTFALFYATIFILDAPIVSMWPAAAWLLAALIPGAAYVSVINDITDADVDLKAGKPKRLAGLSAATLGGIVAATVGLGVAVCLSWRDSPALMAAYLAAWIAFTLYSVKPFRLKERGLLGLIADASGAHLFPALVAILLVFRATGSEVRWSWIMVAGAWAFFYGLRGILSHQITDAASDEAGEVRTFVQRHSAGAAVRLVRYVIFPAELVALIAALWLIHSPLPVLFALLYIGRVLLKARHNIWPTLAQPRPGALMALEAYYTLFLPLAILAASSIRFRWDLLAVVAHLVVFPGRGAAAIDRVRSFLRRRTA